MPSVRFTALAVLAALIAATLTFGVGGSGPAVAEPPKPPGPKASRAALAKLKIAPRGSYAGYDRDHFGDDWAPAGESCDTRDRVLQRDGRNVHTASGCRITGTWRSPYDGVIVTASRNVDIDHRRAARARLAHRRKDMDPGAPRGVCQRSA